MALAGPHHDLDGAAGLGHAERVGVAVDHERGHGRVEFGRPRGPGTAGWMRRKGEREHADGTEPAGGPRRHPGPRRTTTDHERHRTDLPAGRENGGDERGVELAGGRGRATTGHPIGLGHPRDREPGRDRRIPNRDEVGCVDAAAGPMAEDQQTDGSRGTVQADLRLAMRGRHTESARLVARRPEPDPATGPRRGLGSPGGRQAVGASSRTGVRGIGSITARSGSGVSWLCTSSLCHATSMARRSRGVVAPHTP